MASDWRSLLGIAVDLTRSLGAADRYQRLLAAVASVIPCDATALLARRGDELFPLAVRGLARQVLGMRFSLARHPRLSAIVHSQHPVRFAFDSPVPDPFDGLIDNAPGHVEGVHDCLGCPLVADGEVIGVLTADALAPGAFDDLDQEFLVALGALAGAALHTTHLIETVERLAEQRGLVVMELTRGAAAAADSQILGTSPAIERVRQEIELVAGSDLSVLVLGETGVGKELVARAVHAGSRRRDAPLIHVNCAALPESVVESELFGHVRGAFTGATAHRPGKFEIADGGTLLLDEIGELPLSVQPKLLRALQEGEIQRVGADSALRVDVRIIAATNRDLAGEVAHGRFRADLYHRLDVYRLRIPPLRERREDIGILSGHFLDRHRVQLGLGPVVLRPDAASWLQAQDWPGNVRELDHALARAALRAAARVRRGAAVTIEIADLDPGSFAPAATTMPAPHPERPAGAIVPLREAVDAFKRAAIDRALAASGGNWAEAARSLGIDRSNLHHMARRLRVRPSS